MKTSFKLWMTASLMVMGLTPQLHAEDSNSEMLNLGLVVTGVSGVTTTMTYAALQNIYQNNSLVLFEQPTSKARVLDRSDIPKIRKQIGTGDELRITYVTSEAEERIIRMSQLNQRRIELRAERSKVRGRLERLARRGTTIEMNAASIQMRDLGQAINTIDTEISELAANRGSVSKSVATRVVDLNQVKLSDVETYLNNKLDHGKEVLRVERIPKAKRLKAAQVKAAMGGQIVVMVLGVMVTLTELGQDHTLAENEQEIELGQLFVPELQERADIVQ